MKKTDSPKAAPKASPKATPKGASKGASKRTPINESKINPNPTPKARTKRPPKAAPIIAPIVTPENYSISFYSLPNWDLDHSANPHSYGNGGKAIWHAHTEADGKAWLSDNEYYGHFAAVERIGGKIGKSWHVEIEIPDDDAGDDDLIGDYGLLDPDEFDDEALSNPKIMRAEMKAHKLQAQLDALRDAHTRNGSDPLAAKIIEQALPRILNPPSPVAQIRDAKELLDTITPRREPTPAPQPPQRSEEEVLLSTLARNPDVIEKLTGGVFRKLLGGESGHEPEPWYADTVRELVKSGEASKIAGAVIGGFTNLIGNILRPAPVQQQTAQAPQQPPQTVSGERPQALPATDQQQSQTDQAGQVTQGTDQASAAPIAAGEDLYVAMLTSVINQLANNGPVEKAVETVNGFLLFNPIYRETVLDQFDMDAGTLLGAIATIPGCQAIPNLSHSKEWIEKFQTAFFGPEDDQDAPDDSANGPGSVVH